MKLAIIGSRSINNIDIAPYIQEKPTEIISGGARGVDTLASEYARRFNIKLTEFLPDYERYGKGAPIRRNALIVEACDSLIAFWDGKSKGTLNSINQAKKLGKKTQVFLVQSIRQEPR